MCVCFEKKHNRSSALCLCISFGIAIRLGVWACSTAVSAWPSLSTPLQLPLNKLCCQTEPAACCLLVLGQVAGRVNQLRQPHSNKQTHLSASRWIPQEHLLACLSTQVLKVRDEKRIHQRSAPAERAAHERQAGCGRRPTQQQQTQGRPRALTLSEERQVPILRSKARQGASQESYPGE